MRILLNRPRFENVLTTAEELFGVERRALLTRRTPTAAAARLACYAALKRGCEASLCEIAYLFDRDHTSILSGIRKAEADATHDSEYADAIDQLARAVRLGLPRKAA